MFRARRFGSCSSIMQFTSLNKKLSEVLCLTRVGLNVHKFDLKLNEALCRLCSKRVGSNVHKFE